MHLHNAYQRHARLHFNRQYISVSVLPKVPSFNNTSWHAAGDTLRIGDAGCDILPKNDYLRAWDNYLVFSPELAII